MRGWCDNKREWKSDTLESRERERDAYRTICYTKTSEVEPLECLDADDDFVTAEDVSGFEDPMFHLYSEDQEAFAFGGGFDSP